MGISPTCQTSTGPSSGSTATALCEGWAIQKCVGIINIREDINFKLDPISLMIVIPMVFKTIAITDLRKVDMTEQDMRLNNAIEMQLKYEVQEMIAEAENQLTGHAMQCTRLRVQYTYESQELNSARFGNNFMESVSDAGEILLFKRKLLSQTDEKHKLKVLDVTGVGAAVKNFIEKDEKKALKFVIYKAIEKAYNTLLDSR